MYFFLGTVVFAGFTCFGNNLSKTSWTFLANIASAGDIWDGELLQSFSRWSVLCLFKALFKVSTNLDKPAVACSKLCNSVSAWLDVFARITKSLV